MKGKKVYIILAGLLVLLISAAVWKSKTGGEKEEVTIAKVESRTITETVAANGKVQPEVEVKISADVSGEIVELLVKEGDSVKQNELLLRIDPDIYESLKARASAALNTTRANLANAKARLAQSQAQWVNSVATFKRNKTLHEQGAISDAEFDAAKASYEVAKAEVEAGEQSVSASEFNVRSAEASLEEAEENLLKTRIYAPVDGTVSSLGVEKGERVVGTSQMAGTEMMRVADLTAMEVNVEVNENDIVRVNLSDDVEIEVDAYLGRKFRGRVTEIANSANTQGLSSDQVTTFDVKIRILRESYEDLIDKENPHLSPFRPGMSATVEVQTEKKANIVTVPIQAVTTREDTTEVDENSDEEPELLECVFVFEEGKVRQQNVEVGIQDSKFIEITSGLEVDQHVVSGPYSAVSKKLEDGDEVEKKEKKDLYKKKRKKR